MRFKYLFPLALTVIAVGLWLSKDSTHHDIIPSPTSGNTVIKEGGEDGDNQLKREAWFDLMHKADPDTNWETIEYQTSMNRHLNRSEARRIANARGGSEVLANGNLTGEWKERGSINQSGSVFVTEYIPETDTIFLISAGGTLFKGSRAGNDWEVVNQDLRFENNFLKMIDTGSGNRLLANIVDLPHYSDDGGLTWTPSTGMPFDNANARTLFPIVLESDSNTIYMMSKKSYWENFQIYKSTDDGETYESIISLASSDQNKFKMVRPHHSDEIFIFEKNGGWSTKLFKINQASNTLELLNQNDSFGLGDSRANLAAIQIDTITRFIAYNNGGEVYQSEDFGASWILNGQMPSNPWSVGLFITPWNPDFMIYGDIECYRSSDAGANWYKVNEWWNYYDDVNGSLHADMMYFNEFKTASNETFLLISNHGGLNIADSTFNNINNLGLTGLNVSQYYDVVTDPIDPIFIYAGSQDQGFQRAYSFENNDIEDFDQIISGDYGHIVFAQNGQRLWTVYPGGWVTLYNFPQTASGINASWEVESDDESVWIPPLMASPDPAENAVYLAGGNMDGGSGSYLIKLTYNQSTNSIDPSQIDYDFLDFSAGGEISMMRTSPVNPDHWYVSTTNGRFFYSYDGGLSWDQSIQFVPEGHYLYGAAIYPSKLDANTVYFAGSGYSNPAVYKSVDGGQSFVAMNTGLPPTLVFELTANMEESMFFAATEAGPYVYVVAEEQWYDMAGMGAPNQTYWSVEFLESLQIIRFGTYGRGIWDFQIENEVSTSQPILANEHLKVFPNPTSDFLNIRLDNVQSEKVNLTIRDVKGREIHNQSFDVQSGQVLNESFSIGKYPKGLYIITLNDGDYLSSKQVVLQ